MAQRQPFNQAQLDEVLQDLNRYQDYEVSRISERIRTAIIESRPLYLDESSLITCRNDPFDALVTALQKLSIGEMRLKFVLEFSPNRHAALCSIIPTSKVKALRLDGAIKLNNANCKSLCQMLEGEHLTSLDLRFLSISHEEEPEICKNFSHFISKIKTSKLSALSLNFQQYRKTWQFPQICLGLNGSKLKSLQLLGLNSLSDTQFDQFLSLVLRQMPELKEVEILEELDPTSKQIDTLCARIRNLHPIPIKYTLSPMGPSDPVNLGNSLQVLRNTSVFHLNMGSVHLEILSNDLFSIFCDAIRHADISTIDLPIFALSEDKLRTLCDALSANPNIKKINISNEELRALNPANAFRLFCTTNTPDGRSLLELTNFDAETFFCNPVMPRRQLVQDFIAFSASPAAKVTRKVKLDLCGMDLATLDESSFDELCDAIRHSTCLDSFKYSDVDIRQLNTLRLRKLFSSLTAAPVTDLDLQNTCLNLLNAEAGAGIQAFFDFVKNSRALMSLNLRGNSGNNAQLVTPSFVTAMEQPHLKHLKLSIDLNTTQHLPLINHLMAKRTLTHFTLDTSFTLPHDLFEEKFELLCQGIIGARVPHLDLSIFNLDPIFDFFHSTIRSQLVEALSQNFYVCNIGHHPRIAGSIEAILQRNRSILAFSNNAHQICQLLAANQDATEEYVSELVEPCLRNIAGLLPQIPPEADDLAQLLIKARDQLIHETGAWHRNKLNEEKAIGYWLQLPSDCIHFAPARAEAFRLVYNDVHAQDNDNKFIAFIEALPYCFDDNNHLIHFPELAQLQIDSLMLTACGVEINELILARGLTVSQRHSILQLIMLRAISTPSLPKIKTADDIKHLAEQLNPIWKSVCKQAPTLIADETLRQLFTTVSDLTKSSDVALPRSWDEFSELQDDFIPQREDLNVIQHLLSKSPEQVDLFFKRTKQFLRAHIVSNNNALSTLKDDDTTQQIFLAEDNLVFLQKLEKTVKRQRKLADKPANPAPKNNDAERVINYINSVNQYIKKRASESRTNRVAAFFFGYSANDYYARRQHWQTVLDALSRIKTNEPDTLTEAIAVIDEGITRFNKSGRRHYATDLLMLKLSIQNGNNVFANKPLTKLINTSRQVYAEQDIITRDVKNLVASSSSQEEKDKITARLNNNLSFYKTTFNNSDAFLNKEELRETELTNAR